KAGDEVVILPSVAGGSSLPGEGPGAAFKVPFQEVTKGQFVLILGRENTPELSTIDTIGDRHARIRYDQSKGVFSIQDLGSGMGTFVWENGEWVRLQMGDVRPLQFDQVFAFGKDRFFKFGNDFLLHPVANPAMESSAGSAGTAAAKEEP